VDGEEKRKEREEEKGVGLLNRKDNMRKEGTAGRREEASFLLGYTTA
jgi:hypothetical protein